MAIQPTNDTDIKVNDISCKTSTNHTIGPKTAHALKFRSNDLVRAEFQSDGNLAQDATNGANLLWTKLGTYPAFSVALNLTATGTVIGDAYDLAALTNHFSTTASGTGAQLPDAPVGTRIEIINAGANALLLYPHDGSGTHNGGSGGTAVSIAAANMAIAIRESSTNWVTREVITVAA